MTTATAQIMNQFQRRPTYNELVEMIEEEELKVKPSIENFIDRRATFFRNNQYGGRFDNPDLVGLQKQEQMRQLKMLKEATMREAMFNDPDRARFAPPATVAQPQGGGFQSPIPQVPPPEVSDDFQRFRTELLLGRVQDRLEQVRRGNREMADEMLSAVSQEELPEGVEQFMMATPSQTFQTPPLSSASETGEQPPPLQTTDEQLPNTVQEPSSSSLGERELDRIASNRILTDIYRRRLEKPSSSSQQQPASSSTENPEQSLNIGDIRDMATETIIYDDRPEVLMQLTEPALKLQLYLRGIDVDDPETIPEGLKKKGRGREITKKQYYLTLIEDLKRSGRWATAVDDKTLRERMQEFRNKSKGSGSSLGSRAMDAGKFLAKEGSKTAVSSLAESAFPGSGGIVKGALDRLI